MNGIVVVVVVVFFLQELRKFVKHDVKSRDGQCLHIILPEVLTFIIQRLGPKGTFNLTKLRRQISEMPGTSVDHSGSFGGTQRRCVKIPRVLVPNNTLELVDEGI